MSPHAIFLVVASGFLIGTIAGGLGLVPLGALLSVTMLLGAGLLISVPRIPLLLCACFLFCGNVYFALDDYSYHASMRAVRGIEQFEGVVNDVPRRSAEYQTVTVRLRGHDAQLFVRAELEPALLYGDVIRVRGHVVAPPSDSYGNYMAKERVHGTLFFPDIEHIGRDANIVFEALFRTRLALTTTLQRLFSSEESAFLAGIILGERDGFTPEFLNALSLSGTMHLTALSGLNMTIIIFIVIALLAHALPGRSRTQFIMTFSIVGLFVAMTGFAVSAMRAALMAFLASFAKESGRMYTPMNAILFSAVVITLWNPKSPVFDLGFQLSFAAVLSIIYLTPVLKRLALFRSAGFLGWRDALAITIAATVGVFPITVANFENFSITALPANLAIIAVIPLLTVLGFLAALLGLIYAPLGALIAIPTSFLTDYVLFMVEFFASIAVLFNPKLGIVGTIVFYATLMWLCYRFRPKYDVLPRKRPMQKI